MMCSILYRRRRGGKYAIGSACIGGGQGIAIVLENTNWEHHTHMLRILTASRSSQIQNLIHTVPKSVNENSPSLNVE